MWFTWFSAIITLSFCYHVWVAYERFEYWRKRGVPCPWPWPLLGTFGLVVMKKGLGFFDVWATKRYGRLVGCFVGGQPTLIISDPDMLRSIFVKDFSHFVNRRHLASINGDLMSKAVNELRDQRWKDVRSVLAPAFTSGRLKQMNGLINECCENLVANLEKKADEREEFDCRKLYQTVTLDVIASTFFGTKVDSQNDPNNAFNRHASKAFNFSKLSPGLLILLLFPWALPLAVKLGFRLMAEEHTKFFMENTREIIRLRQESHIVRDDFIQLMMKSLKTTKNPATTEPENDEPAVKQTSIITEESPAADIISHALSVGGQEKLLSSANYKLTMEEIVAQSVIFFLAGFETTATALTFLTYSLAVDQQIQAKLRQNIEEIMQDQDKPEYEHIAQMSYLDACVNEALRLYPPASRTERYCNKDWEYNGLKVDEGTIVAIPIYAIHRDPEFWPNPNVFDPDRFSYENRNNIKPYTFDTFGQGPRNCIGLRFAYYEIKMVMVHILLNFRILSTEKTEIPLTLRDLAFLAPKNGAWVRFEKI